MARLSPPGFLRLQQVLPGSLDVTFAGAEANVAVSLAQLGANVGVVTALPRNTLAAACLSTLRSMGVDTDGVVQSDEGRFGLYFVEAGANQRPSRVEYDRSGSTISLTSAEQYDWETIFSGAQWLHVTGITPALSRQAAAATMHAVQKAKDAQLNVSCDLNYRAKLWRWEEGTEPTQLAGRVMRELLPMRRTVETCWESGLARAICILAALISRLIRMWLAR